MENLGKKPASEPVFEPSALDRFMAKRSSKASDGGAPPDPRRRRVWLTIQPSMCVPGQFDAPFKVGLEELSSREEILAFRSAGGIAMTKAGDDDKDDPEISGQALAVAFGLQAFRFFNGRRMTSEERDQVWEALGMGGRLAIGTAYMANCTGVDENALRNCLATAEIE